MAELCKIWWNSKWRRRPSSLWRKTLLLPIFSRVCYSGAKFQISSKSDNKWPSYSRFCEIQDGGGGHLESGAERRFYHFSVQYVKVVLNFKFHRNRTINGQVMQDFVKFKMAATAILDLCMCFRFCIHYSSLVPCTSVSNFISFG